MTKADEMRLQILEAGYLSLVQAIGAQCEAINALAGSVESLAAAIDASAAEQQQEEPPQFLGQRR